MAEIITGEFSRFSSNLIDAHSDMKVWLWDCGPEEPHLPEPPDPPSGKEGDPKYDLAKIQFKRALKTYEDALIRYEAQTKEHADWHGKNGGPIEMLFWSVNAKDALINDARAVKEGRQAKPRWHLSARTRGHDKLKNGGLPLGVKPGHGHQAEIERQLAGEKEFVAAMKADPVFGQEIRA